MDTHINSKEAENLISVQEGRKALFANAAELILEAYNRAEMLGKVNTQFSGHHNFELLKSILSLTDNFMEENLKLLNENIIDDTKHLISLKEKFDKEINVFHNMQLLIHNIDPDSKIIADLMDKKLVDHVLCITLKKCIEQLKSCEISMKNARSEIEAKISYLSNSKNKAA